MALQPRIVSPSRVSRLPIPQSAGSPIADALDVAAQTASGMAQVQRQADQQVDALEHEARKREQELADNALIVQQSAEFAKAQSRLDVRLAELRQNAKVGGIGHSAAAKQVIDEEVRGFDTAFGDNERVRQRFTANVVGVAARYETRETLYEQDLFAKAQGDQAEAFLSETENALFLDPDPKKIEERLALWRTATDALAMDENVRNAVRKKGEARLFGSFLEGLYDQGKYDQADALVKSGKLNGVVDDVEPYLRRGEAERRAAAALAEAEASTKRTDARNAIKAIVEKVGLGVNPTEAELKAARAAAVAAGLPEAEIIALDGLGIQQSVNRRYNEAADPTGAKAAADAAILAAKVTEGTATEAEQVAYQQLKGIAEERGKKAGSALKELAGQGAQGQIAALGQLQGLPPEQRFAAAREAGGEKGEWLANVSLLRPHAQQYAIKGRELRTAPNADYGQFADVKKYYNKVMGPALLSDFGAAAGQKMTVAWDIYAANMAANGRTGWDENIFRKSVRIAWGATANKAGNLQGGPAMVYGKMVLLPDNYTAPEMEKLMARADWSGFYYRDGKPAAKADILKYYRPVWVGTAENGASDYKFVDANGNVLVNKSGKPMLRGFR